MIKPEMVPTCVAQKLRRMVYDFETNEYVLIAAALSAWPGMDYQQGALVTAKYRDPGKIILPLPQENSDDQ